MNMGDFKVGFSHNIMYSDPEYRSIYLEVTGTADVSCADREGSETDVKYIGLMIEESLSNQFFKLGNERVPYKGIPARSFAVGQKVASDLSAKNVTVKSFELTGANPDARTQERIASIDKAKSFNAMSPADQMKMIEEANRKAQESLSKLSADQRQQVEEQAKKVMEQMNQIKYDPNNPADYATAMAAAASASAQPPRKKFCTNCGAPAGLGKFCSSCGKPL